MISQIVPAQLVFSYLFMSSQWCSIAVLQLSSNSRFWDTEWDIFNDRYTLAVSVFNGQEVESIVEEERRVAEDARQALVLLEKKRISLQTEIDDLHAALENVRYWPQQTKLHCESKKLGHFFTAYNFRNIEIFTKFGTNQSLFILNIVPEFI